jgi:hypothetical protein
VTFDDPASPTTDFYANAPGNYVFQLSTVDRSLWTQSANISLTITNALIQITANKPQGSDVMITWLAGPSSLILIPYSGTTGYLDVGALTNWPARFYRVQLFP